MYFLSNPTCQENDAMSAISLIDVQCLPNDDELLPSPDSEGMKFCSVRSDPRSRPPSAGAAEFSTPPESPTIKTKEPRTTEFVIPTKEPRTSSSSEPGSESAATAAVAPAAAEEPKPPIPPPRIRRPGNSKLERLKLAEGGGGGGGGGGVGSGGPTSGGVLAVSDMILAPPPPPTNNEHYLKASERTCDRNLLAALLRDLIGLK